MSDSFREAAKNTYLPFGNGTTSIQVMNEVMRFLKSSDRTTEKRFYDLTMRRT